MVVSYGNALVRSARAEGQSGHLHSSFGDLPCAPAEPCRPMELAWFLDALMHRDRTYLIEQYCRTSWKIGRTTHSVTHTHTPPGIKDAKKLWLFGLLCPPSPKNGIYNLLKHVFLRTCVSIVCCKVAIVEIKMGLWTCAYMWAWHQTAEAPVSFKK